MLIEEEITTSHWPPPYRLRRHGRARNINFHITAARGLEITVPVRFDEAELPAILEEKRAWIEKNLAWAHTEAGETTLPEQIELAAIQQHWFVYYMPASGRLRLVKRPGQQLVMLGDIGDHESCLLILRRWLQRTAKQHFAPWLQELADEMDLQFSKLTVRGQRTCWGSCTQQGAISLNYKVLFLTPAQARYIMVHELAHLVHLDHSKAFWSLVQRYDPSWREHRRATSRDNPSVPAWVG